MSSQSQTSPEVFISYSHQDSEYKEHLVKQLEVLAEQKIISQWHDGLLTAGERWNNEIVKRLKSSRVILLLVSVDFLTSLYVNDVELKEAIRRYRSGEVLVIPILVRNTYGWKKKPFGDIKLGDLQALPSNSKFIKSWKDRDDAFANVAEGIQKAVENLAVVTISHSNPRIPPPPSIDFVSRKGRDGRYIVELLKEELSQRNKRLIALRGDGGVGKTTIAAEVARALLDTFAGRIIWASAEKRADFTLSIFLDEIATQLDDTGLLTLSLERKEQAVNELIITAPTLIVLDNFETISVEEQPLCEAFLAKRAGCSALITSRQKIGLAKNISVDSMSAEEAEEFLEKLILQMQDPLVFTPDVRQLIIEGADARPYVMEWIAAQIDQQAQEPRVVLDELAQGERDVAERVFDRSFNLPQVGDDGRATLLALSLFVPSSSREALASVAKLSADEVRLNEAITSLRMLLLIKGVQGNRRLTVEGLTRSLAKARLLRDPHCAEVRQRFVDYFRQFLAARDSSSPENFEALELEKDNILNAMDLAYDLADWESVRTIGLSLTSPGGFLQTHGYWDETIRRGKQVLEITEEPDSGWVVGAVSNSLGAVFANRGNYASARENFELAVKIARRLNEQKGLAATLGQLANLAQDEDKIEEAARLYHESLEIYRELNHQMGISESLHGLAMIAEEQGDVAEEERFYIESLEIKKTIGDERGIGRIELALGNLAMTRGDFDSARRLFDESLAVSKKLGDQNGIAIIRHQMGRLAENEGKHAEAEQLFAEALTIFEHLKSPDAETVRRSLGRVKGKPS